jgi:hypothetical protein
MDRKYPQQRSAVLRLDGRREICFSPATLLASANAARCPQAWTGCRLVQLLGGFSKFFKQAAVGHGTSDTENLAHEMAVKVSPGVATSGSRSARRPATSAVKSARPFALEVTASM